MPRLRSLRPKRPVNHLAALLREHKRASGMTSEDLGRQLGCSADHVRHQIGRPADAWTVGQIKRYCDAIGIPYEEAFAAAAK